MISYSLSNTRASCLSPPPIFFYIQQYFPTEHLSMCSFSLQTFKLHYHHLSKNHHLITTIHTCASFILAEYKFHHPSLSVEITNTTDNFFNFQNISLTSLFSLIPLNPNLQPFSQKASYIHIIFQKPSYIHLNIKNNIPINLPIT